MLLAVDVKINYILNMENNPNYSNEILAVEETTTEKKKCKCCGKEFPLTMFNKKGVIVIEKASTEMSEDDVMMLALDAGAEDFSADEEVYEITTAPSDFATVSEKLQEEGITFLEASVQQVPSTTVSLDEQAAEKMQRLIDNLEDLDDVMNVYHNWEE